MSEDLMQQMMNLQKQIDDLSRFSGSSGTVWVPSTLPFTYASASTFTVSGDYTSLFTKGLRLWVNQTTDKFFYVTNSTHSLGTTTVTVYGGSTYTLANAAINSPYYTYSDTAPGFPSMMTYTTTVTSETGTITTVGTTYSGIKMFGDMVYNWWQVTVTTNGTGATALRATTALTAKNAGYNWTVTGNNISNGNSLSGNVVANGTYATVKKYDNTYPIANGQAVLFFCFYQI